MAQPDIPSKQLLFSTSTRELKRYIRLGVNFGETENQSAKLHTNDAAEITRKPVPNSVIFQHHIRLNSPRNVIGRLTFCIYCGSTQYSTSYSSPPHDEHIIPHGIGGNIIIENASCATCARKINRYEGDIQKNLLLEARRSIGIKGKRRRREDKYFLTTVIDGNEQKIELPLNFHLHY